jgi:leucyl aminopeptidase (aminopeptidase T)
MLPSYPEATRRAFARTLLRKTLRLGRGENLLIETWSATLPWAVTLSLEARTLGARPLLSVKDEEAYWRSLAESPTGQLGRVGAHEWAALQASDAYVYLYGPMDAAREEALPKAALRRVRSNEHELMRVIQKHGVRTVRWDLGRTSELWARRYHIDLRHWRQELIDASLVDPGPMQRDGARIAARLRRGREVAISHPNGTRLFLRLAHRRPKVDDGVIDDEDVRAGNIVMIVPTGVTSVTVHEAYAEGTFAANATGVLYARNTEIPLPPARWSFRQGHLEAGAGSGPRGARRAEVAELGGSSARPGQISVGLNPRLSTIPLLFDQERGTLTLEVGRNVEIGGKSRTPRLSAYMPLRSGTLEIDGETLVDRGRIVVG